MRKARVVVAGERLRLGLAPIHTEYKPLCRRRRKPEEEGKEKKRKISKVEQIKVGSGNPGLNRIIPPPPNPHLRGREGTAGGGGACARARACAGQ